MSIYLYLSLVPEALIASMLPPREFGAYMAVGTRKHSRGHAMYLAVEPSRLGSAFPLSEVETRCVPHADGEPKHSVYLSVYRTMEQVPRAALGSLYLATADGRVLAVEPSATLPQSPGPLHLYQEICPLKVRVVSTHDPKEFCRFMTGGEAALHVPRLFFAELRLGKLAEDPQCGDIGDLPYPAPDHLRDTLARLKASPKKGSKTVDRQAPAEFHFRTVENGFFLGDQAGCTYYPLPAEGDLQGVHYEWWRSASQ
jgi:hypothetical protein